MRVRQTDKVNIKTISGPNEIYAAINDYYAENDTPDFAARRVNELKSSIVEFANTGLKTVEFDLSYEPGLGANENWRFIAALPEPAITRQNQIANIRKLFDRYTTNVCSETNTVTLRMDGNGSSHTINRVTSLFNSNLRIFAEQYSLPQSRQLSNRVVRQLLTAVRNFVAPMALGQIWNVPRRSRKNYKTQTTIVTNAQTPETDQQIRVENFEGVDTHVKVHLNPLSIEIAEDVVVSRARAHRIILHDLETQCQP